MVVRGGGAVPHERGSPVTRGWDRAGRARVAAGRGDDQHQAALPETRRPHPLPPKVPPLCEDASVPVFPSHVQSTRVVTLPNIGVPLYIGVPH